MLRPLPVASIALLSFAMPLSVTAQLVESRVRSWAENEIDLETRFIYAISCDPSPNADPIEDGCGCQTSGLYGTDEKCLDGRLYRFTNLPGDRLTSSSFACDVDACVFIPPEMPPDESLAIAETNYGANFVDVFSSTYEFEPD